MHFLAVVVLFCALISALTFSGPRITPAPHSLTAQVWSSRPTEAPNFHELLKRQSSTSWTLIEGPDYVCGYEFGNPSDDLGLCRAGARCGFAIAPGEYGYLVCFDTTTSAARTFTSCIPEPYAASCLADSACSDNPGIGICTDTVEPYCNLGTFVGLGVEAVWCDSTSYTGSIVLISTTYPGQSGRIFSTISSTTSFSLPSSTTSSSTPGPATTSTTPRASNNTGHIVGGVIGGLALIAGIAVGIFLFLRYKRKDGPTGPVHNEIQSESRNNNTEPQYPLDKYPATAQAAFIPHTQYQQPPPAAQPQYQSPNSAAQPSYTNYSTPQQQSTTVSLPPEQQQKYQQSPLQPQPQYQPSAPAAQPSYTIYTPPQQQLTTTSQPPEQQAKYQQPTPTQQECQQSAPAAQTNSATYLFPSQLVASTSPPPPEQQQKYQRPSASQQQYPTPTPAPQFSYTAYSPPVPQVPAKAVPYKQDPSAELPSDVRRESSVSSAISPPRSPAPPYIHTVQTVPEMYDVATPYPVYGRQEMQS